MISCSASKSRETGSYPETGSHEKTLGPSSLGGAPEQAEESAPEKGMKIFLPENILGDVSQALCQALHNTPTWGSLKEHPGALGPLTTQWTHEQTEAQKEEVTFLISHRY